MPSSTIAWLGGQETKEGEWRWTNGGGTFPPTPDPASSYSNFAMSENLNAAGLQCVGMDSVNGKWLALDCGQSRQYLLCQSIAPPPPLLPPPYPPMASRAASPSPPPPPPRPPFSPIGAGETVASVPSTVVQLGLTISSDIASFEASKASLAASLKVELRCNEPSCFLELRATTAGSVNVDVILTIPDSTAAEGCAATAASTSAAVQQAAIALVAKPVADLTASLGVSVASRTSVQVATGVMAALIVVAAPPPSLPSPVPPSPSPPASSSSDSSSPPEPGPALPSAYDASASGESGGGVSAAIGGGAAAALLLVCVVVLTLCRRRMRCVTSLVRPIEAGEAQIPRARLQDGRLRSLSAFGLERELNLLLRASLDRFESSRLKIGSS